MPAYSYEALNADGKTAQGVLDADSPKAARGLLRAQNLVPLAVTALGAAERGAAGAAPVSTKRAFNATQLAVWTRQLAGLVGAGLPLERALTSLADESEHVGQRNLTATLRAEVNAGVPLARAMAQHPRDFSNVFVAVIGAGEHSGSLGLVLDRLADDLEEQHNLRGKLLGAALYPAIVCGVALIIVMFLLAYVVPQVSAVFARSHQALPLLTRLMLGISEVVRSYGWLILIVIVVAAMGFKAARARAPFRQKLDAGLLRVPVLGRLVRGYNAARFASTLAMLGAAGVPILKALGAAADTLSNQAMRADALHALTLVREGAPLASALGHGHGQQRFPNASQIVRPQL